MGLASSFQVADQQSPVNSAQLVPNRIRDFEALLLSNLTVLLLQNNQYGFVESSYDFVSQASQDY